MINYREEEEEWVMTREGEAESFAIGRASASLMNLGTGVMEWRLREDVCDAPLATALITVCKVVNSYHIESQQRSQICLQRNQFTCHSDGKCIAMEQR